MQVLEDAAIDADPVVVDCLTVELSVKKTAIAESLSFHVAQGSVLGLVGESGSGKTTAGLALLGWARHGLQFAGGSVRVNGVDLLAQSADELQRMRGTTAAYVPQDAGASLNPSMRIGRQVREVLDVHGLGKSDAEREQMVVEAFRAVELPSDKAFLRRWPHQLSGGQLQRVGIACALVAEPSLVVFDEPTTGLDVTTEAAVLDTIRHVVRTRRAAIVYISHDLAVVGSIADQIAVMYAGNIVESGPSQAVLGQPSHPYTRGLIASAPTFSTRSTRGIPGAPPPIGKRPAGCRFEPRCRYATNECKRELPTFEEVGDSHLARCIHLARVDDDTPPAEKNPQITAALVAPQPQVLDVRQLAVRYGRTQVLFDVDLNVARQEFVAIIGESGSGKTTLAKTIAGLHDGAGGEMLLDGVPLPLRSRRRARTLRRRIAYVFQNPYASLNPRMTVGHSIARAAALPGLGVSKREVERSVVVALERVGLPGELAARYPRELSGGERQRCALARAIIAEPDVLICDEVTASLDVSAQAVVMDLLGQLRETSSFSVLFITHNMALVANYADQAVVLNGGRVVECGEVRHLIDSPHQGYTKHLVESTPDLEALRFETGQ